MLKLCSSMDTDVNNSGVVSVDDLFVFVINMIQTYVIIYKNNYEY